MGDQKTTKFKDDGQVNRDDEKETSGLSLKIDENLTKKHFLKSKEKHCVEGVCITIDLKKESYLLEGHEP